MQPQEEPGAVMLTSMFALQQGIETASEQCNQRRSEDFVGQMLWSQQLRATEYFSRWIELKEQNKQR